MPYYTVGDYYGRGDYYQGDGIFSGIGRGLKVLGGAALGAVGGFLKGGPVGAAKGAIGGVITTVPSVVSSGIQMETLSAGGSGSAYTPELMAMHQAAVARGAMMVPMIAGPPGFPGGGGAPLMIGPGGGKTPRLPGTNRSTYAVRGGGTSRWGPATGQVRIIPRGTVMVKSRRMNVANGKALRRGLRRAAGFVKLARRAHVKLTSFRGGGKRKKR